MIHKTLPRNSWDWGYIWSKVVRYRGVGKLVLMYFGHEGIPCPTNGIIPIHANNYSGSGLWTQSGVIPLRPSIMMTCGHVPTWHLRSPDSYLHVGVSSRLLLINLDIVFSTSKTYTPTITHLSIIHPKTCRLINFRLMHTKPIITISKGGSNC